MQRRSFAGRLYAMVFIALMGWGLWQGIIALRTPDSRARLAQTMNWEALFAGRTAVAFNYVMAYALPADPWLRAAGGVIRWGVFGGGGPSVRVGCSGWLFLTEELRSWPDGGAMARDRSAGIVRVAARMYAQGITRIAASTPDKARVQQAQLCGNHYAGQAVA